LFFELEFLAIFFIYIHVCDFIYIFSLSYISSTLLYHKLCLSVMLYYIIYKKRSGFWKSKMKARKTNLVGVLWKTDTWAGPLIKKKSRSTLRCCLAHLSNLIASAFLVFKYHQNSLWKTETINIQIPNTTGVFAFLYTDSIQTYRL